MTDIKYYDVSEKFNRLTQENQRKLLVFLDLLSVPGFVEDLRAATPAGESTPPLDVTEHLMKKWIEKIGY